MKRYKLEVDLIPRTSFFNNLRSLLSQKEWDSVRKNTYEKHNYRCQICDGVGKKHPVECHEQWSYDENTGIQRLVALECLCPACHRAKHAGLAISQGREKSVLKQLCSVNNISEQEAIEHIVSAFDVWHIRSQRRWELDVSLIADIK